MDEILNEFEFIGTKLVLTKRQREMAYTMAQCKLLSDPVVAERLRKLQAECAVEVMGMVKAVLAEHWPAMKNVETLITL
jgi:hypothetical protein